MKVEKVKVESFHSHLLLCQQKKHSEILVEHEALIRSIQERQNLTQQFQQRSKKLQQSLLDDQERFRLKLEAKKVWTFNHHHRRSKPLI